jgi:hypothetical protein
MVSRKFLIALVVVALAGAALAVPPVRRLFHPLVVRVRGAHTVDQRLAEFTGATARLKSHFDRAGVAFPPARVVLLGLKDERRLEVYAGPPDGPLRHVVDYPVAAASGSLGPKLREGDWQVPEGVYPLESLNPNSRFHVALRVGYPNAFDRETAARDGRQNLGGDIMIHGGSASVGCLAMGDDAAEELFVLAARSGIGNVTIILSPLDLRTRPLPEGLGEGWKGELYARIRTRVEGLRASE